MFYKYLLSSGPTLPRCSKYSKTKKDIFLTLQSKQSWLLLLTSCESACQNIAPAQLLHPSHKDIKQCHLAEIQVTYLAGQNQLHCPCLSFQILKTVYTVWSSWLSRRSVFSAPVSVLEERMEVIRWRATIGPDWVSRQRTQSRTKDRTPPRFSPWWLNLTACSLAFSCSLPLTAYRDSRGIHGLVKRCLRPQAKVYPKWLYFLQPLNLS